MTPTDANARGKFRRIRAEELKYSIERPTAPLLLDVRRAAAFDEHGGIPAAVPFALDRDPILLPVAPRDRPVVVYCL